MFGPTSKLGRQIELINFSVPPAIASLAETFAARWAPHQRLFEQTRRAAKALVQAYLESLPARASTARGWIERSTWAPRPVCAWCGLRVRRS